MADETTTPVADVAPTLAAAGLSDERLNEDLRGKKAAPVAPEIPDHHKRAAYEHLVRGDTVEQAAQAAGVPVEVASLIADEIDAVCDKLKSASPVKRPAKAEQEHGDGKGKPEDVIK